MADRTGEQGEAVALVAARRLVKRSALVFAVLGPLVTSLPFMAFSPLSLPLTYLYGFIPALLTGAAFGWTLALVLKRTLGEMAIEPTRISALTLPVALAVGVVVGFVFETLWLNVFYIRDFFASGNPWLVVRNVCFKSFWPWGVFVCLAPSVVCSLFVWGVSRGEILGLTGRSSGRVEA